MVTGLQVRLASLDVCQYVGHLSIGFLAEHSGTDNLRVISSFGWGLTFLIQFSAPTDGHKPKKETDKL